MVYTGMAHTTLIDTRSLADHLGDPQWVVFDCRHDLTQPNLGAEEFARSHVPGARFAHCDHHLAGPRNGKNGRHPLPGAGQFAQFLEHSGVTTDTQIVAYDAQGGMFAARLWWLARWLGHQKVAVLDGGWAQWLAENRAVESGPRSAPNGKITPKPDNSWVDAEFVLRRPTTCLLLDARAPDRFRGENETLDPVGGHIPGARNRFYRENLGADGKFKRADVLAREFAELLGNANPREVIHSCGSGVSACHNLLAMEAAGLSGSKLYAGSWSEWCADPARPVATGPG